MKFAFVALLAFGMLIGCGARSTVAAPTFYAAILPVLSSNGGSIQLTGGASGSLTFSSNNAPARTTIAVSPIPAPTPKWPLPDQIAGYAVTLNNAVAFNTFPPVMCVSGSFSSSRMYELDVTDSSGRKLAQLPATVNSTGVCTAATSIQGQMQANEPYNFVMMMSTNG